MNNVNSLPSERVALLTAVAPSSSSAAQTSGWVDAAGFRRIMAVISAGVFGSSATIDAKLRQATSSGGAGAKDITGAALTQMLAAGGNNKQAIINLNTDSLDATNGYRYVGLTLTVGTAASLVSAELFGFDAFNDPASMSNPAAVVQTVSA